MLIIFFLIAQSSCQFVSYLSLHLRLPGRCREGDFDCGFGHCIPVRNFHDGRPDCADGSDEWCLLGQVRCGAYCVELRDSFGCLFNSKCDGSSRQPSFCEHSKEKLCREKTAFPCKGYGECVTWDSLLDGQRNCIDGSDEDAEYIRTLEGPLRCYFNRTSLSQPKMVNYNRPRPTPPPLPTIAPLPTFSLLPLLPPCSPCLPAPIPLPAQPFSFETTRSPIPFPTLVSVQKPDVETPKNPFEPSVEGEFPSTRPSPVLIEHITPVTPSEHPDQGEFFPTVVSDVFQPVPFPTKIDFTVQANIKTVLPKTTASPTTESPLSGQTPVTSETGAGGMAHIHVVETDRPSASSAPATHVDLGTGEIRTERPSVLVRPATTQSSSRTKTTESSAEAAYPTGAPASVNEKADGLFFPQLPTRPLPAVIHPVEPTISYTVQPIIPVPVAGATFGKPDYNVYGPQWLIPIRPGVVSPPTVPPFWRATTPRNPFIPGEGAQEKPMENVNFPTVKIGVVTPWSQGPKPTAATIETVPTIEAEPVKTTKKVVIATTERPKSTEESQTESTTSVSTSTVAVNESCLQELMKNAQEKSKEPYCTCDAGMIEGSNGCQDAELTTFRLKMDSICGGNKEISDEDKAKIASLELKEVLPYPSCISSDTSEGIVANVDCHQCNLSYVQDLLLRRKKDVKDVLPPLSIEGLNTSFCESSSFNNCHKFALCIVDPSGERYNCKCKAGTEDISNGKGRDCFGFPEEDDCIKVFNVCLIVWLLFLFGFLFCCPLLCFLCFNIHRYYKTNAIHPISLTIPKDHAKKNGVGANDQSGTVMASILVDALRHSAKGISAVSHSITKPEIDVEKQIIEPVPLKKPEQLPVTIISPIPTPASQRSSPDSAETVKTPSPVPESRKSSGEAKKERHSATPSVETPILEQLKMPTAGGTVASDATSVHSLPIPTMMSEGLTRQKSSMDKLTSYGNVSPVGTPPSFRPPPTNTTIVTAEVHRENVPGGNDQDTVSFGVLPTIWETYRAVGVEDVGAQERQNSSSSLDSLIGHKFNIETEKVEKIPSLKPSPAPSKPGTPVPPLQLTLPETVMETKTEEVVAEKKEEAVDEIKEIPKEEPMAEETTEVPQTMNGLSKTHSSSSKLAEMLGVTLDDQNDMKALSDMAERKIELPLAPEATEAPDAGISLTHPDLQILSAPVEAAELASVLRKEERLIEQKEKEQAQEKEKQEMEEKKKKEVFVPKAVREKKEKKAPLSKKTKSFLSVPSRGDGGSSTEESDPEVAFYKRMEALKRAGRQGNPFPDRKRRYRKPERQLSSISEKSAEIASEAAIAEPSIRDFTVSAPNTTRSLSDWHSFVPRHRRFDTKEDTDVDIPSKVKRKPYISSPEIPDVSISRSQTRLNLLQQKEDEAKKLKRQTSKSSVISGGSVKEKKPPGRAQKSFLPEIDVRKPGTSKSHSSEPRSHRPSLISRKIATRKTEMRTSQSASDLTLEQQETFTRTGLVSKREKITKSEEFLSGLPKWDSSPYREGEKKPELPPIHHRSTYSLRSVHLSPTHRQKGFGSSHSLATGRSGSSISLSPFFDPREGNKPPKEELWWTTPRD